MKILHIIANLGQGGAEGVLYRLISASPPNIEHVVVSMRGEGYFGPQLRASNIVVHTLDKPRGRLTIRGLKRLRRLILDIHPDVVQTWMYHADLVGGVVARWLGVQSVVWGIRHSNLDPQESSFSTRLIARICAPLSHWIPAAIACCSERAAEVHQAAGYCRRKFYVIPNGYDLSRLKLDPEAGKLLRLSWGVQPDELLLGMVARWDPQKDHGNLLCALGKLMERAAIFRCVLVGSGMDQENAILVDKITRLGLAERMILAGPLDDITAVMNALDLHVLSSAYGEAFPNVVAESMACGIANVVTDVGDAALIVGTTGWVVPPNDSEALAGAIQKAAEVATAQGKAVLGQNCRARIQENFELSKMVAAYSHLWQQVR
ncbi:MAG: glycosyltransferase [Sulfuritalea sp.]|nr:glycosyltransferase [Sulfuritalea sp.]